PSGMPCSRPSPCRHAGIPLSGTEAAFRAPRWRVTSRTPSKPMLAMLTATIAAEVMVVSRRARALVCGSPALHAGSRVELRSPCLPRLVASWDAAGRRPTMAVGAIRSGVTRPALEGPAELAGDTDWPAYPPTAATAGRLARPKMVGGLGPRAPAGASTAPA